MFNRIARAAFITLAIAVSATSVAFAALDEPANLTPAEKSQVSAIAGEFVAAKNDAELASLIDQYTESGSLLLVANALGVAQGIAPNQTSAQRLDRAVRSFLRAYPSMFAELRQIIVYQANAYGQNNPFAPANNPQVSSNYSYRYPTMEALKDAAAEDKKSEARRGRTASSTNKSPVNAQDEDEFDTGTPIIDDGSNDGGGGGIGISIN